MQPIFAIFYVICFIFLSFPIFSGAKNMPFSKLFYVRFISFSSFNYYIYFLTNFAPVPSYRSKFSF